MFFDPLEGYERIATDEQRLLDIAGVEANKAELGKLLEVVEGEFRLLEKARNTDDPNNIHWTKYTKQAFAFLKKHAADKAKHEALKEFLDRVQIPVTVTSEPGSGEIYLDDNRSREKQLTPPAGTGVIWVDPYDEFTVRVTKAGFDDYNSKPALADKHYTFEGELTRKQMRPPLSFGSLVVEFGANNNKLTPVLPMHNPRVMGDGLLYFVDQSALLRSFALEKPGKMVWLNCPGGNGCVGKGRQGQKINEVHRVGFYGDPVPGLEVADDVILISSLGGYVSARDRTEGHRIWRANVGSPVTSPARYLPNNVVAAGTADGRVVFISEAGNLKRWEFQTDNAVVSAPYLVGSLCVVGSTDNRLYVLERIHSGQLLPSAATPVYT